MCRRSTSPRSISAMMRIIKHNYWDDWFISCLPGRHSPLAKSGFITQNKCQYILTDSALDYISHQRNVFMFRPTLLWWLSRVGEWVIKHEATRIVQQGKITGNGKILDSRLQFYFVECCLFNSVVLGLAFLPKSGILTLGDPENVREKRLNIRILF